MLKVNNVTLPVVSFDNNKCHIELNYPKALTDISLANLKKLFALMFGEHWRNAEAIEQTELAIKACIDNAKAEWHESSKSYTDGYKTTDDWFMPDKEKRLIERNNKKLLNAVKKSKKAYERFLKVQKTFEEVKYKYIGS